MRLDKASASSTAERAKRFRVPSPNLQRGVFSVDPKRP